MQKGGTVMKQAYRQPVLTVFSIGGQDVLCYSLEDAGSGDELDFNA